MSRFSPTVVESRARITAPKAKGTNRPHLSRSSSAEPKRPFYPPPMTPARNHGRAYRRRRPRGKSDRYMRTVLPFLTNHSFCHPQLWDIIHILRSRSYRWQIFRLALRHFKIVMRIPHLIFNARMPCLEHEPPPCPCRDVDCHAIIKDWDAFWIANVLHSGEAIPFLSYLALYRLPGLIPQPLLFVLPQIGAMKINHVIGRATVSRHGRWRTIDGIYPFDDLQGHGSLRKRRTRHTGICFRGT